MEAFKKYDYNFYIGTVRGVLANFQCKSKIPPFYNYDEEKSEITALEWGNLEEEILVGYKNGVVKLYNSLHNKFTKTFENVEGKGGVVGLGVAPKAVIIARHSGDINICKKKNVAKLAVDLGHESTLECMTQSPFDSNIIGIGGEKNDLKLWDLNSTQCTFKAKSLGHDELNLPIPTTIRSISFLESQSNLVCCASKEGHVLLYDGRVQRKPIVKFTEPKASYTAISSSFKEKHCVVGTTKGYIQLLDLRSPVKCIHTYKSFTGGVTSLYCDPTAPYVVSTSLDRHIRIHNLDTKELLFKKYMKQSLTKVLTRRIVKEESSIIDEGQETGEVIDKDQEYEDLFTNMEVISDGKKKRKPITSTSINSAKKKK